MIGTRILNYEIKSLIGEGGMGAVYMAEHLQVNRKVAIKVLHPKFLKNEEIKQRFKNEAATLSHLHHPNIVGLFDYLEDESGLYLIMEYVDGVQLDDYIINTTGPMPEEKAIPLIKQILSAFAYAHEKGVVHRDIKPANILITKTNEVKILDFGIAKILGESNNMTKTGTQMGTVFYMSPEQVQGKKADVRSDIYSLGVTFYQMLTGVNPYQNITTEYEVYTKIVKEDLPPANQIYPGVSAYLVSILKFALEKDPDLRFQNCTEILKAIEDKNTTFERFNSKNEVPKIDEMAVEGIESENESEQEEKPKTGKKQEKSTALTLGIISILICWVPGLNIVSFIIAIIAIIVGNSEIKKEKNDNQFKNGKGKSGKILGLFSILVFVIVTLISVFFLIEVYENMDSDSDGVPDRIDNCINEYGDTDDGCPNIDTDGDGVFDKEDNCVDESGPSENKGCPWPDSDKDGVLDKDDNCPSEFGVIDNGGCPLSDKDKDGITDDIDECPNNYGSVTNNGCPDYDGDGVIDKEDDCPEIYGPNENYGCPWSDYDDDGVLDKDDKCKYIKGPSWNDGCPYNSSGSGSSSSSTSTSSGVSNNVNKKVIFTNNSSESSINVAVCFWNGDTWVTEGWYVVKKGKSVTYSLPANYSSSKFYYTANGGGYTWTKDGISKCVSNNAFTYYDNIKNNCPKTNSFKEKKITGTSTNVNFGD